MSLHLDKSQLVILTGIMLVGWFCSGSLFAAILASSLTGVLLGLKGPTQ